MPNENFQCNQIENRSKITMQMVFPIEKAENRVHIDVYKALLPTVL